MANNIESIPSWDLSDLFSSIDDPKIEESLANLRERAEEFAEKYRGKINNPDLTTDMMLSAITEYEAISQDLDKPLTYAHLRFSVDTTDASLGAFIQRMQELTTEISIVLLFFGLELLEAPEDLISRAVSDPSLANYRHYVTSSRLFRPYMLSEPEEKILEDKANTGRRAFTRLFETTTSSIAFHMVREGEEKQLTMPEVLALLRDPDRETRRSAAASLTQGLSANQQTLTFIFNTLIQDKAVDDRLRKMQYPEQARNLSNELDPETVELVVSSAVEYYPLVARYYETKREILGYDTLTHYDRYAPIFETRETVEWSRARTIVLDSFGGFSPTMRDCASDFFDRSWIDAQIKKGKRGGAYCSYVTPDLHPYVFMNYLSRMDDVMTLAHELGHGVHARLAGDKSYFNFSSVLPLAELASTFGEMLVFESLQKSASDEDRLALYGEKIESAFATIFRQAAMYRFEQAIHARRRSGGELTTEEFSAIWQENQQQMFGDSVELGEEHRLWWMYVPHFINSPFYVYAYTFGELVVMALYARYKQEGKTFAPKYLDILRVGGSMTPAETLAQIGVDIHSAEFWQGGLKFLEGFVQEFERLRRCKSGKIGV
jgi:oligoendopeptidase F